MSQSSNTLESSKNALLHAALLRGAISVTVDATDIRRGEEEGRGGRRRGRRRSVLSLVVLPAQTDYILRIAPTSAGAGTDSPLMAYACSKQYVDLRDLAGALRRGAEETVRHYEETMVANEGGDEGHGSSRSHTRSAGALLGTRPFDTLQVLTKSEPTYSNFAAELDEMEQRRQQLHRRNAKHHHHLHSLKTSQVAPQCTPGFVREVLAGVDGFYEAIYSEKRQFFKGKTATNKDYEHMRKKAEQRTKIIDGAFATLLEALRSADLAAVPGQVPPSLGALVRAIEGFLISDVVVVDGSEGDALTRNGSGTSNGGNQGLEVDTYLASLQTKEPSNKSIVIPLSLKRRATVEDREIEESFCKMATELRSLDEIEEASVGTQSTAATVAESLVATMTGILPEQPSGILPEQPTNLAILVVVGTALFKALEGRGAEIPVDALVAGSIACGLLGYQLGRSAPTARCEPRTAAPDERPGPERAPVPVTRRGSRAPRPSFHKEQSLRLLRQSLQKGVLRRGAAAETVTTDVAPAKTFPMFPEGATIGSHLNCWSSPASTQFRVRGPNYLKDKKKVPSGDYLLPSRGCDLFLTDNPPGNLGRNRSILEGRLRDVPTFIINYRLPWGVFLSYHEIPVRFLPFLRRGYGQGDLSSPLPLLETPSAGERALCNFFLADTEGKNEVLKIVPVVVDGPWMVKTVVGGKPALVGQKMPITYTYQPREGRLAEYLEADLDIVSSAAARNILAVVRSYTQVLTIDLGYVVQGNQVEELPEQMMLGLRLHGLDPLTAELLPEFDDDRTEELEPDEEDGYNTE